jgi:predicted negative regulator of RcsB-dependent stress response
LARSKKPTRQKPAADRKQSVIPADTEPVDPNQTEALSRDFLDDFLFNAANYLYVRRKRFILLAVALVVVIVSAYGGYRFLDYRDTQRHEKLFLAERIINDPQLSEMERFRQAMPILDDCIDDFKGTRQFPLALLYRGGLYYEQQRLAEAEADFRQVLTVLDERSDLRILASIYLANVLQDQLKPDDAVEVLHDAKGDRMTDMILMELADAYTNAGLKEDARQILEVLVKDYPNSRFIDRARQLLQTL